MSVPDVEVAGVPKEKPDVIVDLFNNTVHLNLLQWFKIYIKKLKPFSFIVYLIPER